MMKPDGTRARIAGLGAIVLLGFLSAAFILPACRGVTPVSRQPPAPVIEYLASKNVLWVRGFSRQMPATMDDLLTADQKNGWNLVSYEPAADTWTVKASLWIGNVSTWEPTYVQIGRPGHERETVIVKGFVWIRPPRKSLPGPGGKYGLINRLTLGDPTNAAIRATLKIDCRTTDSSCGLFLGDRSIPGQYAFCGGDLFVFNSAIYSAAPDATNRLPEWVGGMETGCYGTDVRLRGATLSQMRLYGVNPGNSQIERTVFENGRYIFAGGFQQAVDCTFRNLECTMGGNRLEMIRCSFESNAANWGLQNAMGYCVEAIDCQMGPPKKPVQLRKNTGDPRQLLNSGIPVYPFYIERRSLTVKVTDVGGGPIPAAVISLSCPEDQGPGVGELFVFYRGLLGGGAEHLAAIRNPVAVTGREGLTPRKPEDGALLPALRRLRATDDPLKPREETLAYRMTVEAAGYQRVDRMLTPDELAAGKIEVVLRGLK